MTAVNRLIQVLSAKRCGDGYLARCPAHDDRRPSFSFKAAEDCDKIVFHCFAGCDPRNIIEALKRKGIWQSDSRLYIPRLYSSRDATVTERFKIEKSLLAQSVWRSCQPIYGTKAEDYLRQSRGIKIRIPDTLRFLPYQRHRETNQFFPILVAAAQVWPHQDISGLQRIYLDPAGNGKAKVEPNKMSLGPIKGAAVRLAPAGPVLGLTEGIEDALSVMQTTQIPCWAGLGQNLENIVVPSADMVPRIIIFADADSAGQSIAQKLKRRLMIEGHQVKIATPVNGKDFNESLLASELVAGGGV